MLLFMVAGCQDEEFVSLPVAKDPIITTRGSVRTSALEQGENGYWKALKRVPLVGEGRIVNDISDALVSVLGQAGGFGKLLDTDLDNAAEFKGVADVQLLGNQLASVRDLNRVYEGGQTAGFVYKIEDTGLLTAEVLQGLWLGTYLNGHKQETKFASTDGKTLDLTLLSAGSNDGKQALSISTSFSMPFDEIKIGMTGIKANVVNAFSLYYAFVGENKMMPCIKGSPYFPNVSIHENKLGDSDWSYSSLLIHPDRLIDTDLTNGVSAGLLAEIIGLLKGGVPFTVNLGKTIPVGSEIGFCLEEIDILGIEAFSGIELVTYDDQDQEAQRMEIQSLLGLSVLGGGSSTVSLITTAPCSQVKIIIKGLDILAQKIINYAFVRDPIEVDASSYFSLSDVTISGNSYSLFSPAGGNTEWVVLSSPSGTVPQIKANKITGMTVDGEYKISGTFTDAQGNSVTQTMTITRKTASLGADCNQTVGTEYEAEAYMPEGGGSLITLDQIKGYQNLVDDNPDNYATYTTLLSLAANRPIMGIETKRSINVEGQQVKAGFVMQTSNGLLGADVLKFFVIKLYNGSELVASNAADGNNAVDVGLIGNKGNKVRIGITTDREFNKIELWTAGVLNLNLEQFRLYNAYWELADAGCIGSDPSEACIELLTPASHGAEINYDVTRTDAVADVGSSFNNLGNLLDADQSTYSTVTYTNVIGRTTVAVRFNEMPANTQVGFIVANPAYLADVDLLKGTILEVYHNGNLVASTADGGVLGLDVIGYTERIFLETKPGLPFDEVRIVLPAVAGALEVTKLFGSYIRRDSDNDGIPDCAEDEENGGDTPGITDARAESEHVCTPEDIIIRVTGGKNGSNYTLECYNYAAGNATVTKECMLENGRFVLSGMSAGDYYISIKEGDKTLWNALHVAVHPLRTTWKTAAATSDWNDWSNWTDGTPWGCTDVVIPSGCANYPVLKKGENHCAGIHFCAGAEVVNTHYLTYDLAWVELSILPGRYYMLSAPLKEMVTGDMFIPSALNGNHGTADYFTSLTSDNTPESRFTPRAYQRLWSSNAPGQTITGRVEVTPDATNWTPPFNALNQSLEAGMGFSLKAGNEPRSTYTFRFPKLHESYTYVNGNGVSTGITETISRTAASGRFIYENTDGSAPAFPYTVTVKNQKAGSTFIAGNPFMAHIDIKEFLRENALVTSVKVYDGNTNNSLILADGQLLGNDGGYEYIAPMQSFFVTVTGDATELKLTYTEQMLVQKPGANLFTLRGNTRSATRSMGRSVSPAGQQTLRLSAYYEGTSADCLVRIQTNASDGYLADEDSKLLIDNEVAPLISVFTEADGKALDIQQFSSRKEIPVGFSLKGSGRVLLTLSHASGSKWDGWELIDSQTGRRYPLSEPETLVDLGEITTHAGRFCLVKDKEYQK